MAGHAPSMPALLAAHRELNVDPGFIPSMSVAERKRVIEIAASVDGPLSDRMEFCHVLRKNAYACEALGEPANDPINGRDLAAAVFKDTQPRTSASDRAKFCAWQLLNLPRNSGKLYLPQETAHAELIGWDAADAIPMLMPHPRRDTAVTTKELHAKQYAISRMWRDATVVCGSPDMSALDGLDDIQRAGAAKILATPASILTGGGGVGKSFCVKSILRGAQSSPGCEVVCLAPTHKAKYNIAEAVPEDVTVSTIQSYALSLKRGEPIDALFVVIDESSMLDVDSLGDFAQALCDRVARWQICLVGDDHQLPPVGRGECFRLAVRQAKDVVVRLEKCYRAAFVKMFDFHRAVRRGELPDGDGEVAEVRFYGNDREVMAAAAATIQEHGEGMTYIAWRNADVDAINKLVQLKETGEPKAGRPFNVGDAVIYVGDNKPNEGLTNAMCGRVAAVQKYSVEVTWSGDAETATPTVAVRDLRLAYCLTVHKAQGSGFANVCVVCTSSSAMLNCLDRRWLYTAVSRAQRRALVLCTKHARALAEKPPPAAPLSCLSFKK
jgi:AAA domain/UvrD-like helicase C-terminal domain